MRIFDDWRHLPADARGATIALGNFDGVHLGHAAVIRAAHAARADVPLAVLTFEPHPRELFRPDDPPFRLTLSAARATAPRPCTSCRATARAAGGGRKASSATCCMPGSTRGIWRPAQTSPSATGAA